MKKKISIALICILVLYIVLINIFKTKEDEQNNEFKILTSFYPLYVATINITDGANNISVSTMTNQSVGCIHDYTLTTEDLKNIEKSDLFIENGKSLEPFTDQIKKSYPDLKVLQAGIGAPNIIQDEDEANGHIWIDIQNYKTEILNIKNELVNLNLENKDIYENNYKNYLLKIEEIEEKIQAIEDYKDSNVICLNESLEYLLEDIGANVTMVETDHGEMALSASEIKNIIDESKQKEVKAIFIDINDDTKIADMIKAETGAKIIRLNSEMSGNLDDKDAYINAMNLNIENLKNI